MSAGTDGVFVTGASGYMGSRLIPLLLDRGHRVCALVRDGAKRQPPVGCAVVVGNALDAASYADHVNGYDTFVHLVGTPKPSPAKAAEFERVDCVSIQEAVRAATSARISHFVHLSVAQPSTLMRAYVAVRTRGEALIRDAGLPATFLRPWYVRGPGHRWPYALLPLYWLLKAVPPTRERAQRIDLVTLPRMLGALVQAVATPPAESPAHPERGRLAAGADPNAR